ncbi:DUF4330 family protein [Treponema sp. R6D11]
MSKLKHKFTWFDAIIAVAVLAVVAGIFLRFSGRAKTVFKHTPFEITLAIAEAPIYIGNEAQDAVDKWLTLNEKSCTDNLGKIVSIDVQEEPIRYLEEQNGKTVFKKNPDLCRIIVKARCEDGYVDDKGFWTSSLFNLGVGQKIDVKGPGFGAEYAIIIDIK